MTKRAVKNYKTRSVSFRMPFDLYNEFSAVAESRGVDMSGLLNWMCADYRPRLLQSKAEYEARMLEAAAANLRENLAAGGGTDKALGVLRDLLKQLQDIYAEMMKRSLDEDERRRAG
jgi:hypothetical protein